MAFDLWYLFDSWQDLVYSLFTRTPPRSRLLAFLQKLFHTKHWAHASRRILTQECWKHPACDVPNIIISCFLAKHYASACIKRALAKREKFVQVKLIISQVLGMFSADKQPYRLRRPLVKLLHPLTPLVCLHFGLRNPSQHLALDWSWALLMSSFTFLQTPSSFPWPDRSAIIIRCFCMW